MNQEIISLRRGTSELSRALYEGVILRHGESWIALPREVSAQSVVFEMIPKGHSRPRFFAQWVQALRLDHLMMTGLPAFSVLALGLSQGLRPTWGLVFLSYLGVLCFHLAVHFFNLVEDHLSLAKLDGVAKSSLDLGAIQRGWMSAKQLRLLGWISLGLGMVAGLPAVSRAPMALLGIGAFGALGALSYSGRPFTFRNGWAGDFIIWLLLGPLLCAGYSFAFFDALSAATVVIGLFFGFLAWTVHHADHLSAWGVSQSGRSLARLLGFRSSRLALVLGYVLGLGSLLVAASLGWISVWVCALPVLAAPQLFLLFRQLYQASGPSSALLRGVTDRVSDLYAWMGLLLLLNILLSHIFP